MLNKSLTEKRCLLLSQGTHPQREEQWMEERERRRVWKGRRIRYRTGQKVRRGVRNSFLLKIFLFQNKNNQNQLILYLQSAESFICIKDICKITRHFHWKYCRFPLPGQFVLIWYCRSTFSVRSPCVIYQCLLLLKARIEPFLCIEQCAIKKKQALCAQ